MHYPIFTANEENRFFSNFKSITFTSTTSTVFHFGFCNFPESFTRRGRKTKLRESKGILSNIYFKLREILFQLNS